MKKNMLGLSAAALVALAGQALAQVAVDGKVGSGEAYSQLWVQNQPTQFGDNVATFGSAGDPENVRTGLEIAIPASSLGVTGTFRLTAFFTTGNNPTVLSNQLIGAANLASNAAPIGAARPLNFASIPGNQYLTLSSIPTAATAPVLDGTLDDSTVGVPNPTTGPWANSRVWTNATYSSLGNNTNAVPNNANGTELDNFHVVQNGGILYFFFAGNFHNFNRLWIFVDAAPGGQNRLVFQNADGGFGSLRNMGATSAAATDGLTFDAGFEPEQVFLFNAGNNPNQGYWNYITLPTPTPDGLGGFTGAGSTDTYQGGENQGVTTLGFGGNNTVGLSGTFDNSNIIGVSNAPPGPRTPNRDIADGSEINSLYGYVDTKGTPSISDDELNLLVAGNLENSFNKVSLFFDVNAADGQNVLRGSIDSPPNVDADFNGLNRMGAGGNGAPSGGAGLKFESAFTADYWIGVTNGNNPVEVYANAAVLRANGRIEGTTAGFPLDFSSFDGGLKSASNDPVDFPATYAQFQDNDDTNNTSAGTCPILPTDPVGPNGGIKIDTNAGPRTTFNSLLPNGPIACINPAILVPASMQVAIDNSNVAGVTGDAIAGAASVTTGIEYRLRLSELGWDGTSAIKVAGFLHNGGYDFTSNQVIGGIDIAIPAANLGETSQIDFSVLPGNQVVIVPVPTTPICDSIDFNNDTLTPDSGDLDDYIAVLSGGPSACSSFPTPGCNDLDFNNDGLFPDSLDLDAFISRLGGGPCLQ
jgi:hypothetical protein